MSTPLFGGDETVPTVPGTGGAQRSHRDPSAGEKAKAQNARRPTQGHCLGLKSKSGRQARRHRSVWAHVSRTTVTLPEHRTDLPPAELSLNKAGAMAALPFSVTREHT